MTTQDQKDKKISTAERTVETVQAQLDKATERLANLEREFVETQRVLRERVDKLTPELAAARDHLTWVQAMPVSGKASGEVGAIETPEADSGE